MIERDRKAKEIGSGLAVYGLCASYFLFVLAWDLFELYTIGEVQMHGTSKVIFNSGSSLLIFHVVMSFLGLIAFALTYKSYKKFKKEYANT